MSALENKRVLVTGANGFIGAWLCHRLVEQNTEVIALIHDDKGLLDLHGIKDKVTCVSGDVESTEEMGKIFKEHKPELCYHLAAKSSTRDAAKDLHSTFKTNVLGTVNILGQVKDYGCAVVFVSTVKTYGGFTDKCFDEEQKLGGTSAYASSKIAAEAVCRMFAKNFDLSVSISRPGNVFGGYDDNYSRLIPGAIKNIFEDNPPIIKGAGESKIDLVYIEDVVDGLILLGEKTISKRMNADAYNFGSGESHSVKEAIEMVAKAVGKDMEPEFAGEENVCTECLCIEKAEKDLGWKPKHSLKQGLEKTVADFEKALK